MSNRKIASVIKGLGLILAMMLVFCACGKSTDSDKASEQYASYWTDEQKSTIDSMNRIDEEGYLYEMNYTADYDLDELIAEGCESSDTLKESFQKLYLPDSDFETPVKIYGACSAFATKNAEGHQILGRNYDWDKAEEVGVVVHTAPENGYKSVAVADLGFLGVARGFDSIREKENALYAPLFVVDGLNEKGLAATVLVLEEDGSKQQTGKEAIVSGMVVRLLLDKAATVAQAQDVLEKYDLVSSMYASREDDPNGGYDFHWLVTDEEGDAAVFEYVDNKLVVSRTPVVVNGDFEGYDSMSTADINKNVTIEHPEKNLGYQLLTNFYVTEGAENTTGEGYWRYQTLSGLLADNPNPTTDEALGYLEKVKYGCNDVDCALDLKSGGKNPESEDSWAWITVWSEVYDTESRTLTLCLRENYDTEYTFRIEE